MAILLEISQIGKREDLADLIAVADQKGTPVTSMLPKGKKPTNTLFDWQMDAYPDPVTTPHVDGTDITPDSNMSAGRVRAYGRVHNFVQDFGVSHLAEDVSNVAGIKSEFARSAAKAITVIKRAAEVVFCGNGESAADNGTTQGYATRGLGKWVQNEAQSDLAVAAAYRTPAAQIYSGAFADFSETSLQDLLQARYDTTGESKTLTAPVGSKLKRKISEFAQWDPHVTTTQASVRTFNQNAGSKKIVNTVDIYQGDFGTIEIVPSVWLFRGEAGDLDKEGGFILDMEQLKVRYHSLPQMVELEDRGAGPRGFIRSVCGLEVGNPLGLIKIAPAQASGS